MVMVRLVGGPADGQALEILHGLKIQVPVHPRVNGRFNHFTYRIVKARDRYDKQHHFGVPEQGTYELPAGMRQEQ